MVGEVNYWKPYPLSDELGALRDEMRRHARKDTKFRKWTPDSDVLDLEARYAAIKARLDGYVAAHK